MTSLDRVSRSEPGYVVRVRCCLFNVLGARKLHYLTETLPDCIQLFDALLFSRCFRVDSESRILPKYRDCLETLGLFEECLENKFFFAVREIIITINRDRT